MKKTTKTIKNKDLAALRCGIGHGGNNHVTRDGAIVTCIGCGHMWYVAAALAAIGTPGTHGDGSLYDARS